MPTRKSKPERLRLTAAQCRAVDQYAIQTLGIPSIVLMENAGRNVAELIERWAGRKSAATSPRVSIVCGKGNNGGDGFVVARHLAMRGFDVSVDLLGDPTGLSPDAAVNYRIARSMGLPVRALDGAVAVAAAARRWRRATAVVDALLGTGFAGEVREPLAGIIKRINSLNGPLVAAIDVPSGLNADTGEPGGVAVQADRTVTFLAEKVGFSKPGARPYVGRISVVDIGAPMSLILPKLQIQSFR